MRSKLHRSFLLWTRPLLLGTLIYQGSTDLHAMQKEKENIKNPFARNPEAIDAGKELFLTRCAVCHGTDGKGSGRGPNLTTGQWAHGRRDSEIFNNIKKGLAGTEMPPNDLPDNQLWQMVAFIRSLGVKGDQPPVPGNPEKGENLFFGKARCSTCHMIRGHGSPLAPELSNIGAERSAMAIKRAILDPDAEIADGFMGVGLKLKSGERIDGVIRNEDNFSIQVMDTKGRFRLLEKQQVSSVTRLEKKSFMPSTLVKELADEELQDLLAFLDRQRTAEVDTEK